jgi:hypothetical protein
VSLMSAERMGRQRQKGCIGLCRWERLKLTSLVSFDHQPIDRCQLGVAELADSAGLDVGHVGRACAFEVLECFGYEEAQDSQACCLDCIEDFEAVWSVLVLLALSTQIVFCLRPVHTPVTSS